MKHFAKRTSLLLIVVSILLSMTVSCKKEDKPAPTIPPSASFVMSFNGFTNPNDTIQGSKPNYTYQNWGHSAFNVGVWNVVLTVGLAVPVASFIESFNHEAVYDSDEENWTWSYNFNAGGVHTAKLTGHIEGDYAVWEMKIDDFSWYTGKSHINNNSGYWILNESRNVPTPLLRIDWQKNSDGTTNITYTNVKPNGPENGGYIAYGISSGAYTRFYNIFNKGQNNLTSINWNHLYRNGRVKDANRFQDTLWHYWGTNLADTILIAK